MAGTYSVNLTDAEQAELSLLMTQLKVSTFSEVHRAAVKALAVSLVPAPLVSNTVVFQDVQMPHGNSERSSVVPLENVYPTFNEAQELLGFTVTEKSNEDSGLSS